MTVRILLALLIAGYGKSKGVRLIGHHETGGAASHYEAQWTMKRREIWTLASISLILDVCTPLKSIATALMPTTARQSATRS